MEDIIYNVKHVLATILTLIMLPLSFMMPPTDSYEAKDPDALKTSFTVVSDIHIEGNNYPTVREYAKVLKSVKNSKDTEALVFLGDNTMNGQEIESIFFYGGLRAAKPAKNLIIASGNHDYGNGNGGYEEYKERFIKYANLVDCDIDNNYYYKVIDGYYFIVLSSESDSVNASDMSDAQLQWLNGVLDEAAKEDKPIFVFAHHPVNYVENGPSDRLSSVLDDYEDVIFFCGHTHWALSENSVSVVNGVQSVNVPRSIDYSPDITVKTPDVGAVVEVYENEVLLRFRDLGENEWIEGYEYTFAY